METTVLVYKKAKHVNTYGATGCPNYRFLQKLTLEDYNTTEPCYKKIEGRVYKVKHTLQVRKGWKDKVWFCEFKTLIHVYLF